MKRHSRIAFIPWGLLGMLGMTAVFGTITLLLWNVLMPSLFGLPVLSWLQAVGLVVLCRILFGGISGGMGRVIGDRRRGGENLFRGRWDAMSDEQRQRLAEEIKRRHGFAPGGGPCGGFGDWFNSREDAQKTTEAGKDGNENDRT